jgi:ethanolamine utilization microcompartment shell protein EutS
MTERRRLWVLGLLILGFALNPAMPSAQPEATAPASGGGAESLRAATVLTIHGRVTAVDKAEKLVTIQVPSGEKYTLKVENPYNLDAASVGTGVVVRYYEAVSVRKKKAGESLPALSVSGGVVTAKAGGVPGAVADEHLKAVVSVVQVDRANGTVTIKGADGSVETAKANNPKVLSDLKAGDDLVITASRATAISLDKEAGK